MNISIDTSAFLAVLNSGDRYHPQARDAWAEMINSGSTLFTSNYIVLETTVLLQHRFGMDAVRLYEGDIVPLAHGQTKGSSYNTLSDHAAIHLSTWMRKTMDYNIKIL